MSNSDQRVDKSAENDEKFKAVVKRLLDTPPMHKPAPKVERKKPSRKAASRTG